MNKPTRRTPRRTTKRPVIKTAEAININPNFWSMSPDASITIEDVLKKPYQYQTWVYACATTITNNLAPLPKMIVDAQAKALPNHPVLDLLKNPNPISTQQSFLRHVFSLLLLPHEGDIYKGGQCFIIPWNGKKDSKVDLRKEMPDELFVYSGAHFEPNYVEMPNGRRVFKSWKFGATAGAAKASSFEFYPWELIRINFHNPYDLFAGMPPTAAVAQAIEMDARADTYNQNIFENDGRLAGQVSTEQYLADDELEKIKKEWGKQYTGMKRRSVAFLTGGMKYEQFGVSAADMQYMEQAKWLRSKIIAAYRLNRIAVGDYEDINFATIREGRKMLWQDTYIPTDQIVLDAINNQWVRYIDEGLSLISNYSRVPALQGDMGERVKNAAVLVSTMAFPPSLASRIFEIPLTEQDVERWPHLNEPVKQAAPAGPVTMGREPTKIRSVDDKKEGRERREAYSEDYIQRVLEPSERAFRRDLDRYFSDQRNGILDQIDAWSRGKKAIRAEEEVAGLTPSDFLYDIDEETQKLTGILEPNAKNQAKLEKKQIERDLGKGIAWSVTDEWVEGAVEKRVVFMEEINTTTFNNARDAIAATLKQGVEEGWTTPELAKEIKQAVRDVYAVRMGQPVTPHGDFDLGGMSSSMTIARTEMGSVATQARVDAYTEEGIKKTEWITSKDDYVRPSHQEVDGEIVDFGEAFGNGLRWPRDMQGDAEEVINCRCVAAAVTGE